MLDFIKDFFREFLSNKEYEVFLQLFERKTSLNIDPYTIYKKVKPSPNSLIGPNKLRDINRLIYLAYARAGFYENPLVPLVLISLQPFENYLKGLFFYDRYIEDIRKDLPVDQPFPNFMEAMFCQLKKLYKDEIATLPPYYRLIDEFFRNNSDLESYYKHNHLFVFYILSRSSLPFFEKYLTEQEFKIYLENVRTFSKLNAVYFEAAVLSRLELNVKNKNVDETSIVYLRFLAYYRAGSYSRFLNIKSIHNIYNKSYLYSSQVIAKYNQLKQSAKSRNIKFSLTFEDVEKLLSVKRCYYTGIRFKPSGSLKARTIDRIDNKKGYEKGNVVACCRQINMLKSDLIEAENSFTYKQIKSFIDKLDKRLFEK